MSLSKVLSLAAFPVIVLSGVLGRKLAVLLWGRVFGEPPPDTAQQHIRLPQLLGAAVVEGTIWQLSRMAIDRGLRQAIATATGSWPGEPGEGE
jgi:hypothetical protein